MPVTFNSVVEAATAGGATPISAVAQSAAKYRLIIVLFTYLVSGPDVDCLDQLRAGVVAGGVRRRQ